MIFHNAHIIPYFPNILQTKTRRLKSLRVLFYMSLSTISGIPFLCATSAIASKSGIFNEEGYEFVDDIIWVKPEGAGWATGRGRRFAADRNPLQYKTVPVTEHVLVYRKRTDKLIDWNIRNHPNQKAVKESKIDDSYERTDIWRITPAHSKRHPAIFPKELAEKIIKYYSFKTDVVLDPFGGIGTVGEAATKLGRRFVLVVDAAQDDAPIRLRT